VIGVAEIRKVVVENGVYVGLAATTLCIPGGIALSGKVGQSIDDWLDFEWKEQVKL
jgi:hypothetical protein